jgi:hypothetical protein
VEAGDEGAGERYREPQAYSGSCDPAFAALARMKRRSESRFR